MQLVDHWQRVYQEKAPDQVSWFQADATMSRQLIEAHSPQRASVIVDVGGGVSRLVDGLREAGYRSVAVLDLSETALRIVRDRLGARGADAQAIVANALDTPLADRRIDVWHDRAVFHFLTTTADRQRYVAEVRRVLRPGGIVIVSTFAADGPTRCSGLEAVGYSPEQLHGEFGRDFELLASQRELHATPSGAVQAFTYCACRRSA